MKNVFFWCVLNKHKQTHTTRNALDSKILKKVKKKKDKTKETNTQKK